MKPFIVEILNGTSRLPEKIQAAYRAQYKGVVPTAADSQYTENSIPVNNGCKSCGGSSKTPNKPKIIGNGPGSQLLIQYESVGMPSCAECYRLAALMDKWGVEECSVRLQEIVNDIYPRAKQWLTDNKPWVHRLLSGVGMEESALKYKIRQDVIQAIETARTAKIAEDKLMVSKPIKWAYGVTTHYHRLHSYLPTTLESLSEGGFDKPWLFIDDCPFEKYSEYHRFQAAGYTYHSPVIKAVGNWILGMYELMIRIPNARYYAMFQDDILVVKELRQYLEKSGMIDGCYYNLYTFPENQQIADKKGSMGWFETNQWGRSATGLVFTQSTLARLLSTESIVNKVLSVNKPWKNLDGAIVNAMSKHGYKEYCHNPSLIQHIGDKSVIGNKRFPKSKSFSGEKIQLEGVSNV